MTSETQLGSLDPAPSIFSQGQVFTILCVITAIILLPNILLLSVDDISIASLSNALSLVAKDQASNGRYSFSALTALLDVIGGTRASLQAAGALSIIIGMPALFLSTIGFASHRFSPSQTVLGFCIFASYGLFADLYQFSSAFIQTGSATLTVAAVLTIARGAAPVLRKWLLSSFLGWIALGFYQTFPYVLLCSLIAAAYLELWHTASGKRTQFLLLRERYVVAIASTITALASYLVTSPLLKAFDLPGFRDYPQRAFGARYVVSNAAEYARTIFKVLNPFAHTYAHFTSRFTILLFGISVIYLLVRAFRHSRALGCLTVLILALTAVALPDPTNILLATFWPSPRSVSPIAILVACAITVWASTLKTRFKTIDSGTLLLASAVCLQFVIYADLQARRADQQNADFITAISLINRAYETFPDEGSPLILTNFDWHDNVTMHDRTFEFGESYFVEGWSRRGLIQYLSNGRVRIADANPSDCAGVRGRFEVTRLPHALLVCSRK